LRVEGVEGMLKMNRLSGVAIALAFTTLVLAGASGASNRQVFADPVGDAVYGGGYAPDITAIDVTTADNGAVAVRVAINEPGGHFYIGDTLAVLVDTDMNPRTGDTGAAYAGSDLELFATATRDAGGNGVLKFQYCLIAPTAYFCRDFAAEEIKYEKTGANSFQVIFTFEQGNWLVVGLRAVGFYTDPNNPASVWVDWAPSSGQFQYDAKADPDGDRVPGAGDKCPTYRGGKFDARDGQADGCPPFLPAPRFVFAAIPSGNGLMFRSLRMVNAGPATVTARLGGLVVHRRGSGSLPRVGGRHLSLGSLATFIYTNPNYFGSYKVARGTRAGVRTVRTGCTPPGRAVLISCPKVTG
jgi:hypothetical protein